MTSSLYFLRIPARRLAGYLFCVPWIALPLQVLAQQPGSQRTLKEISRPYYAAAEFELSHLDATNFDIGALQKAIGTAPASLIRWVRNETRWVPYAGALKGARGTLLARQGNLLDRNLLLAALLEAGGREVRLVHFETSLEQQKVLRKAVSQQRRGGRAGYQRSILQAGMLESFCNYSGLGREEASRFIERQASIEKRVEGALKTTLRHQRDALFQLAGDRFSPALDDPWVGMLGRYVYVQHRSSKNDSWESAHLISRAPVAAGEINICAPDEIPEAWLHQVGIKVVVVQQRGKKIRRQVALERWIPTAMAGLITGQLQLVPADLVDVETLIEEVQESRTANPLTRRMAASRAWLPLIRLEGMQASVGNAIDRSGRLIPVSRIGATGQNEEGLGKALGFLNKQFGGTSDNDSGILKEVRIEFSSRTPGQDKVRVMTRPLYTRLEDDASKLDEDQMLKRSLALNSRINLLLTSGHLPASFATQKQSNARLGLRLATDYITAKGGEGWHAKVKSESIQNISKKFHGFPTKLYGISAARASDETFQAQPNAIAWWERLTVGEGGQLSVRCAVDFIENHMETVLSKPEHRFRSRMASGVRDSIIETEALRGVGKDGVSSTARLFAADGYRGWKTIATREDPVLKSGAIPKTALEAMNKDLEAGYVLVARSQGELGTWVWWRLNMASGEVLGMAGAENWVGGQGKTEYLLNHLAIALRIYGIWDEVNSVLSSTECLWQYAQMRIEAFQSLRTELTDPERINWIKDCSPIPLRPGDAVKEAVKETVLEALK